MVWRVRGGRRDAVQQWTRRGGGVRAYVLYVLISYAKAIPTGAYRKCMPKVHTEYVCRTEYTMYIVRAVRPAVAAQFLAAVRAQGLSRRTANATARRHLVLGCTSVDGLAALFYSTEQGWCVARRELPPTVPHTPTTVRRVRHGRRCAWGRPGGRPERGSRSAPPGSAVMVRKYSVQYCCLS